MAKRLQSDACIGDPHDATVFAHLHVDVYTPALFARIDAMLHRIFDQC
jgi:hypothetical protein